MNTDFKSVKEFLTKKGIGDPVTLDLRTVTLSIWATSSSHYSAYNPYSPVHRLIQIQTTITTKQPSLQRTGPPFSSLVSSAHIHQTCQLIVGSQPCASDPTTWEIEGVRLLWVAVRRPIQKFA